jgi:tripartite-type tricarboxylate transporter receptor subunit TctC
LKSFRTSNRTGPRSRLNAEIVAISASPDLAPILEPEGTIPSSMSASAFAARVKDELATW